MFNTIKSVVKSVVAIANTPVFVKEAVKVEEDLTAKALRLANEKVQEVLTETSNLYKAGDELVTYKKISKDNEEIMEQTMIDLQLARKKQWLAQETYESKSSELIEQKVSEATKAQQLLKFVENK